MQRKKKRHDTKNRDCAPLSPGHTIDHLIRIGSCLACVHRVMDARGKFEEYERSVRVARGAAESKVAKQSQSSQTKYK